MRSSGRALGGVRWAATFDVDDLPALFDKPALILTGHQDCLAGYRGAWRLVEN